MPEFGKRGTSAARPVHAGTRSGSSPNLSAALKAVEQGKLPYWTNIGPTRLIISMLAVAAAYVFLVLPYTGNIWRDHRLAGSWQAAYDMRAMDGKCRRYNFVLTTCTAKIKSLAEPNRAAAEVAYMMGFTSGGGERLIPVRSTTDPSAVTIAYAAETELWNRTLTYLVLTLGLAAVFLACTRSLLRGRYRGGAAYVDLMAGLTSLQARPAPAVDGAAP